MFVGADAENDILAQTLPVTSQNVAVEKPQSMPDMRLVIDVRDSGGDVEFIFHLSAGLTGPQSLDYLDARRFQCRRD